MRKFFQSKQYFFFLFVFLISAGCSKNNNKADVSQLIQKWQGKEIIFPKPLYFTKYGKDTVDFSLHDADYKILSYIDSLGCTECTFKSDRWLELISELDSLTEKKVAFLFFFQSNRKQEVEHFLRTQDFSQPVVLDIDDRLNKINQFPSQTTVRTFLLGTDNKVLLIGNPVLNADIKKLYLNQIKGDKQQEESKKIMTEVELAKVISLKNAKIGKKTPFSFNIKNIGEAPLIINDIQSSCGCTNIQYTKQPIEPNEAIEIKGTYRADKTGYFNKTITIHCNSSDAPLKTEIRGEVGA